MIRSFLLYFGILAILSALALILFGLVVVQGPSGSGSAQQAAPGAETALAAAAPEGIVLAQVDELPEVDDPFHAFWDRAEPHTVRLQRQNMAVPMLDEPSIESIDVQAMSDGRYIAWRLTWDIQEPADTLDVGRFSDAVALQFPLADGAPPIMGSDNAPVHILYWQARWQRDIDEAYQDIHHVRPNFWSDAYWFAEGEFPFPINESFKSEEARQWLVAHVAGNPMANLDRLQPVQELVASGFGTLTAHKSEFAAGRGEWRNGRWAVVVRRPLDADDELGERLRNGDADEVALAVWDGAAGNVGGRKHWTMWVPIVRP